jgi:hypothetical protein
MDKKIDNLLIFFREEKIRLDNERLDLSTTIIQLLKGVDPISVLPELLADIFEAIESPELTEHGGIDNLTMTWGTEHYVTRKVNAAIENIIILYKYCVENNHSVEQSFLYSNDRSLVYFIPHETKEILYFSTLSTNFVCIIEQSRMNSLHIREVFDDLLDEEFADQSFYTLKAVSGVAELRDALYQTNGLEIALTNLNNTHKMWSDCIGSNDYPCRISIKNMIEHNFSSRCRALTYGDHRDAGYILSTDYLTDRSEIEDYSLVSYTFYEILNCISSLPNGYIDTQRRVNTINGIIGD